MNPLLEQEYLNKLKECKENAKKYYDSGDYEEASAEYLRCSKYCEILVKKTEDETKKKEYYDAFEKFVDVASKLKRMRVTGVDARKGLEFEEEPEEEKARSFILAEKPKIRFKDIAGLEAVKEQIKEAIVYPFKYPVEYKYFGVKGGGGILLYGPRGCGKTMLAAAAAGEYDAVFINLKISEITMEDFEKVQAKRKMVLSSWYPKAVKDVASTEESEMFSELVEAGRMYLER